MKKMISSLSFLFLLSCTHTPHTLRVQDSRADAFYEESYLRYDHKRLAQQQSQEQSLAQGEILCYEKKFQEGLYLLSSQLEQYKDQPAYWNHIAICYILMEQYPQAIFNLDLGLSLKAAAKDHAPLHNNRALIYQRQRHYHWALTEYKEAIKKSPKSLVPHYNLAQLYLQFGHYEKSYHKLKSLHQSYPKDQEIAAHLSLIYLVKGEHQKALNIFEKLNDAYWQRSDLAASISLLYLEQKRPEDAKRILLRQEITRDPRVRAMSQRMEQRIQMAMEEQRQERIPAQENK